jgi:hypothetical protein
LVFPGIGLTAPSIGDDVIGECDDDFVGTEPSRMGVGEDDGPAELQVDFIVMPLPAAGVFLASEVLAVGRLRAGRPREV